MTKTMELDIDEFNLIYSALDIAVHSATSDFTTQEIEDLMKRFENFEDEDDGI